MQHVRSQAKSMRAAKLSRFGGKGGSDISRVMKGMPSRDGSAPKYASGGTVGEAGPVDGMGAKPRMDRPGRKMGKDKGKKGGTNVNVIVMPKGDAPVGGPPMAGPKPDMPMPPPHPMPMPPPGAGPGGPPMPMRASGGRIANLGRYAHGGKVKR